MKIFWTLVSQIAFLCNFEVSVCAQDNDTNLVNSKNYQKNTTDTAVSEGAGVVTVSPVDENSLSEAALKYAVPLYACFTAEGKLYYCKERNRIREKAKHLGTTGSSGSSGGDSGAGGTVGAGHYGGTGGRGSGASGKSPGAGESGSAGYYGGYGGYGGGKGGGGSGSYGGVGGAGGRGGSAF